MISDRRRAIGADELPLQHDRLAAANGGESRKLASFFWVRKMAEEQRFEELADQDVADWRRGLKRYGDPRHESQYQEWKQTGKLPEPEPAEAGPLVPDPLRQFETFLSAPSFDGPASSRVEK